MIRSTVLTTLALLAFAPAAHATVTGPPEAIEWARLMAVPAPDATVILEPCPVDDGYNDACAYPDGRIYLEPTPGYEPRTLRMNLYHELGHLYATPSLLRSYRHLTRMTRRWHTEELASERFAESYTSCALDALPGSWRFADAYGLEPTRRLQRRICTLILSYQS